MLFTAIAVACCSCSSGTDRSTTDGSNQPSAPNYDPSLPKGKVTDSIVCKTDQSQRYALYLPSYYSTSKAFPCIYFFDAHARGSMPVRMYKDLAEKYGYALIGSDVSKNGTPWDVTNDGVTTLMQDTKGRINIDPKRIYTAGFSGGSRVASSIAILDGGIAGVIGCAAGFRSTEGAFQNKFDYFGIVGEYDFNLTEMAQLDNLLEQNNFPHQLLTTANIHGWASATDFETALLWMQTNEIKQHSRTKNDTLINALKIDLDKRIAAAATEKDLIKEDELQTGSARILDGLTDVTTYKKQYTELEASPAFKDAKSLQQQLQEVELHTQQELQNQFAEQDETWWTTKIAELNKNIHKGGNRQESQMNQRLLNYLGLVGYMYSDHALKTDDMAHAATFLKIFKLADPENPDCGYLSAIYYVKTGNQMHAIASLNEAATLGYSEVGQLTDNPVFGGIKDDAAFRKVVEKVQENYASK